MFTFERGLRIFTLSDRLFLIDVLSGRLDSGSLKMDAADANGF